MRTILKIAFPNDLYCFVRERTEDGAYASTSEYIRALVREDRLRRAGSKSTPRPPKTSIRKANEYMADLRERPSDR